MEQTDACGGVVALSEYRTLPEQPEISLVRDYWDRLRGSRVAPARSEIDPREITPALSHSCILEQIAPGHARFRLAGLHLCDLMGMEVRGMPVSAFFHVSAREALSEELRALFNMPAAVTLSLRADHGLGRPALDGQFLLLPLADRQGGMTRALGCMVTHGDIGYPPRRFALRSGERRRLSGDSSDAGQQAISGGRAASGFAEQPVPYRQRPTLRLVRNDE